MTQIITISNIKGGVGKTTTTIFLATLLSKYGKVLVKDADPQGSLTGWIETIDTEIPFEFTIANLRLVSKIEEKYDFILIDTPPGNSEIINACLNVSNLVIIPTGTSGADVSKVYELVENIKNKKPYAVLFTMTNERTILYKENKNMFDNLDISYFETSINKSEDIKRCFGYLPNDKQLKQYDLLLHEILDNELISK